MQYDNICNMMVNSCHHEQRIKSWSRVALPTPSQHLPGSPCFFWLDHLVGLPGETVFSNKKTPENHWGCWLVASDEFRPPFGQVGTVLEKLDGNCFF